MVVIIIPVSEVGGRLPGRVSVSEGGCEVIGCLENSWVTFEYVRDVLLQPLLCNPDYPRQRKQTGTPDYY